MGGGGRVRGGLLGSNSNTGVGVGGGGRVRGGLLGSNSNTGVGVGGGRRGKGKGRATREQQ